MKRLVAVTVAILGLASACTAAQAGPADSWHYFWSTVHRDFWRNNSWPQPFIEPDRQAVLQPLALQVDNGWRLQNLIAEHHFNAETQQLNIAGKEKVKWVLTQNPLQRRTLFVQRGADRDQTAKRLDSLQKMAAQILPQGELPAVEESNLMPRGWSAAEVDNMNNKFLKSIPDPRLPEAKADK